jgi:uncharacterized protein YegJ (DUF2314 family)
MGVNDKVVTFVTDNYVPAEEKPSFNTETEFLVQTESDSGEVLWYGPISFDDLDAFVGALPENEAEEFITAVKGESLCLE